MSLARQVLITAENEGPLVNIAAWLGMTIMILAVCTRLFSKYSVVRRLTTDDALMLATMVFAIVHTYSLSMMVTNGLGRPQQDLNEEMIENFEEYGYVSQLMYIPALCLAKLSTLVYLRALSPDTPYANINIGIEIFVILWAVAAEFAIAFQCNIPTPWKILSPTCFNTIPFWNSISAIDIFTDLAIIALPVYLVWSIRMPLYKKLLVFIVFGTRIFILPFTALRIWTINTISSPTLPDQISTSYHLYLITTIQLNTAVFVACLPFLKPFMESMSSGGFASTLAPMDGSYGPGSKFSTYVSGSGSRKMGSKPKASFKMESLGTSANATESESRICGMDQEPEHDIEVATDSQTRPIPNSIDEITPHLSSNASSPSSFHFGHLRQSNTHANSTSPSTTPFNLNHSNSNNDIGALRPDKVSSFSHIGRATPEGGASDASSVGSDKMIIKRTTEWDVVETYEYVDGRGESSGGVDAGTKGKREGDDNYYGEGIERVDEGGSWGGRR